MVPTNREEAKVLMKDLFKQQVAWREELQAAGALVGVPSFQLPPKGITVVSSSSQHCKTRPASSRDA